MDSLAVEILDHKVHAVAVGNDPLATKEGFKDRGVDEPRRLRPLQVPKRPQIPPSLAQRVGVSVVDGGMVSHRRRRPVDHAARRAEVVGERPKESGKCVDGMRHGFIRSPSENI